MHVFVLYLFRHKMSAIPDVTLTNDVTVEELVVRPATAARTRVRKTANHRLLFHP